MEDKPTEQPGLWRRFQSWLGRMYLRVVMIKDTPHSIALGVAIGIFFGFSPLWSLKTLLSIAVAWICKGSKVAAAVSVSLHDVILPFMPAIYLWEYKLGFWAMHGHLPRRIHFSKMGLRDYAHWESFITLGRPLLIGSIFIGLPSAVAAYFICLSLVKTHRARRAAA
ncbi:MAG: DUF2062 domain-containing protein [Chthoniobacterales bacterium]